MLLFSALCIVGVFLPSFAFTRNWFFFFGIRFTFKFVVVIHFSSFARNVVCILVIAYFVVMLVYVSAKLIITFRAAIFRTCLYVCVCLRLFVNMWFIFIFAGFVCVLSETFPRRVSCNSSKAQTKTMTYFKYSVCDLENAWIRMVKCHTICRQSV